MTVKYFVVAFLLTVDSDLMSGVKKIFGSEEKKELVDPYFVFSFAGQEVLPAVKLISQIMHHTFRTLKLLHCS